MPLVQGKTKADISRNIEVEIASGKKKDQAVAIALDVARKSGAKIKKKSSKKGIRSMAKKKPVPKKGHKEKMHELAKEKMQEHAHKK